MSEGSGLFLGEGLSPVALRDPAQYLDLPRDIII